MYKYYWYKNLPYKFNSHYLNADQEEEVEKEGEDEDEEEEYSEDKIVYWRNFLWKK